MPANFGFNPADLIRFLPEMILTVVATFMMVLDPLIQLVDRILAQLAEVSQYLSGREPLVEACLS